jgi:Ca2+-binding RTX toxin-like protein
MATFIGLDDNPTYTEDGPRVPLDDDAVVVAAPPTYNGTTLTLARDGGASPDDVFGGGGTLTLDEGQVLLQETSDNDTFFVAVGTYTSVDGMLVITFNANATQARVNAVLEQITYGNASDGPPPSVTIDFTFNDGVAPATGDVTVAITGVNDAPELGSVSPVAAYRPGSPGVVLSPTVTIADRDSTTLVGAEVRIVDRPDDFSNPDTTTDTPDADDVLSADPGGTGITVSYNPATHVLTLSGTATLEQYRQVLDTVTYSSTDPDPSQGGASTTRTIEWELNDGGVGNNLSAVQTTILHFTPSLDLDGSAAGDNFATAYTEDGAAAPVADTDAVVTNGGANLTFATVTLTNAQAGDTLSIAGPLPGGITGSVNTSIPGQIIVSLGGSASPASYQAALRQVVFSTTSDTPNTATLRDIAVVVGDDTDTSNTAHTMVAVTAANDAPTAQDGAAYVNENASVSGNVVATDPDNPPADLTYSLDGPNGGAQHGTVALNPDGSFIYTPATGFFGSDSFGFQASDGAATGNVGTIFVSVNQTVGGPGGDTLAGSPGDDTMTGDGGDDYLTGQGGNDTIFGDAGTDTVLGGNGNDYLNGGADDDHVFGGDGADFVLGDTGNDYLNGEAGDDHVFGGDGADIVIGDAGNDYLNGENGNDTVGGGAGADTVIGDDGDDYLSGGDGNDTIGGGTGDDTLFAGSGSDYLVGGGGDDFFVFDGAFQTSVIVDFTPGSGPSGHDVIQFNGGVFTSFADVMAHATQSANNVIITDASGDTVTLANVLKTSLVADDFRFA